MLSKQNLGRRFSRASGQREGSVGMSGPPRALHLRAPGKAWWQGGLAGLWMWRHYQIHSGMSWLPTGMSVAPARHLVPPERRARPQAQGRHQG